MAKLVDEQDKAINTAALPYFMTSGIREIWLEMMFRCIDIAITAHPDCKERVCPSRYRPHILKKVAPVKRIGAVSPAAREMTG